MLDAPLKFLVLLNYTGKNENDIIGLSKDNLLLVIIIFLLL